MQRSRMPYTAKARYLKCKAPPLGVRYFSVRSLKAVQKSGSRQEQELTNQGEVWKDQAQLLLECCLRERVIVGFLEILVGGFARREVF